MAATEHYKEHPADIALLWLGLLVGPNAWMASQQLGYLLSTLNCSYGKSLYVSPLMLLMSLIPALGIAVSYRNVRRTRSASTESISRSRGYFMAVLGLLLSVFSLLGIIAEWLPVFFYRNCER